MPWQPEFEIAGMGGGPEVLNVPVLRLEDDLRGTYRRGASVGANRMGALRTMRVGQYTCASLALYQHGVRASHEQR